MNFQRPASLNGHELKNRFVPGDMIVLDRQLGVYDGNDGDESGWLADVDKGSVALVLNDVIDYGAFVCVSVGSCPVMGYVSRDSLRKL